MTPPKLQITDSPVISDEMITFRWLYNEQASSTCTLQTPTSMAIIPCINNSVMLAYPQEGYSLYIQGTDLAGNTAEAVQLTWTVGELILPQLNLHHSYMHACTRVTLIVNQHFV